MLWSAAANNKIIDTQPLVASNVQTGGGPRMQIVYFGDDSGAVHAVDATNGQQIWSQSFGITSTPCGHGTVGVTSTPVIDRATNRIYVLSANDSPPNGAEVLYALDLGTGAESPGFAPLQVYTGTAVNTITWSALNISADGSLVFFPTSSHSDTEGCGTFYGTANAVNTLTQQISTYQAVFDPNTYFGDGIWSWGGESIDPDSGNLYLSVGNSWNAETDAHSDSVLEVTPSMQFVADEQPEKDLNHDLDIGTTPVLYDDQGQCAAFERKDGNFFTIDRTDLVNLRYRSKLNFGGYGGGLATAAYSPANHALYISVQGGLTKLDVGPNCTAVQEWQTPIGGPGYSVPAVANGVVYAAGGSGEKTLYAVDAGSGTILWTSGSTIGGAIVQEPTVVNGRVYVAAWDGQVYAFGLQGQARRQLQRYAVPIRHRP